MDKESLLEPLTSEIKFINTAIGGLIEGSSGSLSSKLINTFWEKATEAFPNANYHLQKAIRRAYLQAALQVCVKRGNRLGIPIGLWIPEIKSKEWFSNIKNIFSKGYNWTKNKLTEEIEVLSIKPYAPLDHNISLIKYPELQNFSGIFNEIKYEGQWLYEVYHALKAELKRNEISRNLSVFNQSELLIAANGRTAKERLSNMKAELVENIIEEIHIFHARYGTPYYENLSNEQKKLAETGLIDFIFNGWEETAPDGSIYLEDFFSYMCANFHNSIKFRQEISNIFNAEQIAKIITKDEPAGKEITIEFTKKLENKFESWGGLLSIKLENSFKLLESQSKKIDGLAERFDELLAILSLSSQSSDKNNLSINDLKRWLSDENQTLAEIISEITNLSEEAVLGHLLELSQNIKELEEAQVQGFDQLINEVKKINPKLINKPQTFVALPNFTDKTYGRTDEINEILKFLKGRTQHSAIVAPSCFGKTSLIKKFLYKTTDTEKVKDEYKNLFEKVIYINCDQTKNFSNIIQYFALLIGDKFKYTGTDRVNFLNLKIFNRIQTEKILLIFDNFESWINSKEKFISKDIRVFVKTLLNSNHQIRSLFVSKWLPQNEEDFVIRVKKLDKISESLMSGLSQDAALELIKKEGKEINLHKIKNKILITFLEKVCYIPQAVQSMIGYISKKEISFSEFFQHYEEFERDELRPIEFDEKQDKLRPTKTLLKMQVEAQGIEAKHLLSMMAFLNVPLPSEILTIDFSDKDSVLSGKASENLRIALGRLKKHYLINKEDVVIYDHRIGERLNIGHYSLHPYIRSVILEAQKMPKFESVNKGRLIYFGDYLGKEFNKIWKIHLFSKLETLSDCMIRVENYLVNELGLERKKNLSKALVNKSLARSYKYPRLGNLKVDFENLQIEAEYLRKAIELNPAFAWAYNNLGGVLYQLKRYDEAEEAYNKAIEIAPDYRAPYWNLGGLLEDLGKYIEAEEKYSKVIELEPDYSPGYITLFRLLKKLDKNEEAEDLLKRIIELEKNHNSEKNYNNDISLNNLANLFMELKRYEEAEDSFKMAIKLYPFSIYTYNNFGDLLIELKRFEEAEKKFNTAIKLNPDDATAYYNLARLGSISYKKDNKKVFKYLKLAIDIDSRFSSKAKTDTDFDFIRDDPKFAEIIDSIYK